MRAFSLAWTVAVFSALALGACSVVPVGESQAELPQLVRDDLSAALASAEANDDKIAAMCWQELLKRAGEPKAETRIAGVFSAYQTARNVRRKIDAGVADELRVACAPMVMESQGVILRLGALVK